MAVRVWTAMVDRRPEVLDALGRTLSAPEAARTAKYRFEPDRVRHTFRRGMLRHVLGRHLDVSPEGLMFRTNAFGKPALAGAVSSDTTFNLSHSGDMVVIAVASGRDVGVDVEAVRPIADADAIAATHFADGERTRMASAGADRDLVFLRLWTRKEAYVKGVGGGLSIPLTSFDVSSPEAVVTSSDSSWMLSDLPLASGYVGAIAVEHGGASVECREWTLCA